MNTAVRHLKIRILAALLLALFGNSSAAVNADDEAVQRFQAAGKRRHASAQQAPASPAASAPANNSGYDIPNDVLNHYGLGEAAGYGPATSVSTPPPRPANTDSGSTAVTTPAPVQPPAGPYNPSTYLPGPVRPGVEDPMTSGGLPTPFNPPPGYDFNRTDRNDDDSTPTVSTQTPSRPQTPSAPSAPSAPTAPTGDAPALGTLPPSVHSADGGLNVPPSRPPPPEALGKTGKGKSKKDIAEPSEQTQAGLSDPKICKDCLKGPHAGGLSESAHAIQSSANQDLLDELGINAVKSATESRSLAQICGGAKDGSIHRQGNVSKCMCAAGLEEALNRTGLCQPPIHGDAILLSGNNRGTTAMLSSATPNESRALPASCPAFHKVQGKELSLNKGIADVKSAPAGSVIVYSTSRMTKTGKPQIYGHVEVKVQVTAANIAQIQRMLGHVTLGQYLYCSDFCTTNPNFAHGTNRVEGIYSL